MNLSTLEELKATADPVKQERRMTQLNNLMVLAVSHQEELTRFLLDFGQHFDLM